MSSVSFKAAASKTEARWAFTFGTILALLGIVYVGNTWSPSSYALALRMFQAPDDGLVAGTPRPIRSDEWAVLTPYTQIAVNRGFERYNVTSPYREDLRFTLSLPVRDWGFVFKPTMWLYGWFNPAYAFSFHHFATIALFLVGYTLFFRSLGARRRDALLLCLGLFFTAFVQYWWTMVGPLLAWFPWILNVFSWRVPLLWRTVALFWVNGCFFLSLFYPPLFIPCAFVVAVVVVGVWGRRSFKELFPLSLAAAAGAATACWYLRDWMRATLTTVYPGQRRVSGGSTPGVMALEQLFPLNGLHLHESLGAINICELAVVGAFYPLMVVCFLNYGPASQQQPTVRRGLIALGAALGAVYAWMFLPIPRWAGRLFLWDFVPPSRMAFAAGLLLLMTCYGVACARGLRLTRPRTVLFAGVLVGAWFFLKFRPHGLALLDSWRDLWPLVPVLLLAWVPWARRLSDADHHTALLGISLAAGILAFGDFNPLQSAWPIFNRPRTSVSAAIDAEMRREFPTPVVTRFPGAIMNGWGYCAGSHVLAAPPMELWRRTFPELEDSALNEIFNRYAHIIPLEEPGPRLLQADAVVIPARALRELSCPLRSSPP